MKSIWTLVAIAAVLLVFVTGAGAASSTPVVLVTGFAPFGSYPVNPSELIAESLNGSSVAGATVVGIVLPVDYNGSVAVAVQAIEQYKPVLVISCGLNARAHDIHVEKIGVNLRRYDLGDGHLSLPRKIEQASPLFRSTTLPVAALVHTLRRANVSVQRSCFAGMYVCNNLFYMLLKTAYEQNDSVAVGFLHVPLLDSQDPQGMPLNDMVDAITLVIQESLPSYEAS